MLMKKVLYVLTAMLMVAVACKKGETPDPTPGPGPEPEPQPEAASLTLVTPAIVDLDAESGIYTIKFTTNKDWTATVDAEDGTVVLGATSGKQGENIELKVTYQNVSEEDMGRVFNVVIKAGDKTAEVAFFQGLVFAYMADTDAVSVSGGKVEYLVITNLEYTIKKYDGAEEAFPWAPVTIVEEDHRVKITFNVAANPDYDARYAYVKITVPAIQVPVIDEETGDPTGETEDYVERLYVYQEGNAVAAYTKALPVDIEHGELNANANVTLAYFNGKLLMSDGLNIHSFNPATGEYLGLVNVPEQLPVQSITNDDAGNVIFASAAGYGETVSIYAVSANATDFTASTLVASGVVSAWTGAPSVDNVRVKGNVNADAVITLISGGGPGCSSISYGMYWEVVSGVVGDAKYVACPADVTDTVWLSNRACLAPAGVTAADGFLYIGYDGLYTLFFYNGTDWLPVVETGLEGNEGFNSIASIEWNGKKLVAFEEMFYFPFWWSADSRIWLVDVTGDVPEVISNAPVPMIEGATPATDVNYEASTSDILMRVEDGNLAIYVVDSSIGVLHKQVYSK